MTLIELSCTDFAPSSTPVRLGLDPQTLPHELRSQLGIALRSLDNGETIAAQWDGDAIVFLAPQLTASKVLRYHLEPTIEVEKGVSLREAEGVLELHVPQGHFTSYHFGSGLIRPFLWPVHGPGQKRVTRDFPMEMRDGESTDHEHHRSIWTAYEEVNDSYNWTEREGHGSIKHQTFLSQESGPVFGGFAAQTVWANKSGAPVMDECRSVRLYNAGDTIRLLDYQVSWFANYGPVEFGDTKEAGVLSVRVASSMEGTRGGLIANSNGGRGESACWGKQAAWCDYSGLVDGEMVGIAIFDHPGNINHPTRWHVRDYGLLAANPFSTACFGADLPTLFRLPQGEKLTFRYRIFIHHGNAEQSAVGDAYNAFASSPVEMH